MKNIKTNSLTKSNIAKLGTLMLALILAFGVAVPIFSACPKVNPLIEQTISLIDNIPTTMTQSNRADFIAAVETAEESLAQLDSQDRAQVINLTILENRISTWRTFDQDAAVNNIIDLTEELKQLMGLEFDFFNPDTQARDALAAARSNVHSQMSPLNSFVFRQEPSVNLLLRLGPQAQTITDAQAQITAFDNALSFNAPLRPLADRIAAVETKATQALINATQIESIDISTDPHAQTEAADAVHSTISELDLLISGLTTDINATTISDAQRNALHSVTDNAFAAASADRNLAAAALSNFRLEQLKEGAVGILSSRIAALHKQASAFNHNAQHNPETDDPYGRTQEQIRYDIAIELAAIQTAYDNLQTFNPPTNDPTSIIQFVGPFNIQDRIMAAQFNQAVSVANTAIQNFDIAVDDLAVGSVRVLLNDIAFVADLSNDDRVDFLAALTIASQAHSNLRPDLQTRVDYETEGRLTALIAQLDTFDHNQAINQAINNVVFLIIQVPDHMPNILPALTTTPEATEAAFETRRENRAEVAGPLDIASAAFDQLETFEFVSAFTGQALQTLDLRPRFEEEPIIIEPDPDEEIEPLSLNILSDETEENGNGEEEDDEDDEEELPPPPPPLPHPSIALARLTLAQTNIAVFDVAYQFLAAIHAIPDEITLDHAVDQVGVNNTFVMSAREATDLLNQNPAARALFTNQQFNNRVILLTAAETEITTQLADIVVPLVISRDGNTITFNNIVQATHFEISYDFISYTGDDEDEAEIIHNRRVVSTVANTNAPSQTYTVVSNGFVTNLSVRAIMNEGIGTTRIETLQAPLSQTPSILINETFLSSDKSLVTAFNLLVQNNSTGANNNAIMSFLADTALSQVSNHAYVNVRARGLSSVGGTLLGAGNMNRLDVGSDTILNFNEDGSVYNSYRLIFASPDGPAIASDAANRRDRVFYDSTTDLVHSQLAGNNASNSANRTPLSMQAWQNANGQGAITPYGFMGYILNPAYMAIGSSANLGSAGNLNLGTVARRPIEFNESPIAAGTTSSTAGSPIVPAIRENTFTFTFAIDGRSAGRLISREHVRSGGIADVTYNAGNSIALSFAVCALTLDMVSYRSRSLYVADSGMGAIGNATTRVDTTAEFVFNQTRQDLPWTGNHADTMPTWAQLGVRPPVSASCFVEGTLITMADGSQSKVETLKEGDLVKVWNFYTGQFDIAPILTIVSNSRQQRQVISLDFSNGANVQFAYEHAFFSLTQSRFVDINAQNAHTFVGQAFKYKTMQNGSLIWQEVVLTNVDLIEKYVAVFVPITADHFSVYANNVLTAPSDNGHFINIFNVLSDLRYCQDHRQQLIDQFGFMSFEEFSQKTGDVIPREFFDHHRGKYLNVSLGQDLITWEKFMQMLGDFAGRNGLI